MRFRRLGDSDLDVSEICLGSWLTYGAAVETNAAEACVDAAFDAGINFIDTANVYSGGRAEEFLGDVLQSRPRDSYVLATKVFGEMPDGDRGLSREQILKQIDASLARLRTDYVDLYQCHSYDRDVPLEETLEALTDVVRAGKARYIGVSNWNGKQIRAAVDLAHEHGYAKIVSSQPEYSLLHRRPGARRVPGEQGERRLADRLVAARAGRADGQVRAGRGLRQRHACRSARRHIHVALPGRRRARARAAPPPDRRRPRDHDRSAGTRLGAQRTESRKRDRRRVPARAGSRERRRVRRRPRRAERFAAIDEAMA